MKFVSAEQIQRAVMDLPEWSWLRADAEKAWAELSAAQRKFAETQSRVGVLWQQESVRLNEELNREDNP
jgi:hypothetical protein